MHIARWESKSGKHWVNLHQDDLGHAYAAPGAGGSLGKGFTNEQAIAHMQGKVDSGLFQPDAAKTPMRRVPVSGIPPSEEVSSQRFDPAQVGEAVGREWHEPGSLFHDRRGER